MVNEKDALQAVIAALEFGWEIGHAPHGFYHDRFDEYAYFTVLSDVTLFMSLQAGALLIDAKKILNEREDAIFPEIPSSMECQDYLRKAVE